VLNTSRPGEMQVTIQNLMPDTKYRFRVVAHNSNGAGESSAALPVATQAEGEAHKHHRHRCLLHVLSR
jgi:neogenin